MSDNKWIEEARVVAARCWCNETTKHLIMDPALAEVVARIIASWMETAAMYSKNTDYWRGKAEQTGEKIPVPHADAYANRCAEHAYCAAQAAAATAKSYAEFAKTADRDKIAAHAEFGKAALYARYAASAAAEYADAAAKAAPGFTAERAK